MKSKLWLEMIIYIIDEKNTMLLKNTKLILILFIAVLFISSSQSQNTDHEIVLTNNPSPGEIRNLFCRVSTGELDIFNVIPIITVKKDKAIPAIEALLFTQQDSIRKEYMLLALDGISGGKAVSLIIKSACQEKNIEVKAKAIQILAWNQYQKATEDTLPPGKEILHTLYLAVDDTSMSVNIGKRIGTIAREGVKNWSGIDLGELSLNGQTTNDGTTGDRSAVWESYWQQIQPKLKWDPDQKLFIVKGK